MAVKELIDSPSIQREFNRLRSIGCKITVHGTKITIHYRYVPRFIAVAFKTRIKEHDLDNILDVVVKE